DGLATLKGSAWLFVATWVVSLHSSNSPDILEQVEANYSAIFASAWDESVFCLTFLISCSTSSRFGCLGLFLRRSCQAWTAACGSFFVFHSSIPRLNSA